jgi:hypothetical protein
VVGGHFFIALLITIYLLTFVGGPENAWTSGWASFLGITSVVLATIQYVPQIIRTFRRKVRQSQLFHLSKKNLIWKIEIGMNTLPHA